MNISPSVCGATIALAMQCLAAGGSEIGLPRIEFFDRNTLNQSTIDWAGPQGTHGVHHQQWALRNGPDGLLYVASGQGLLIFDGVSWMPAPTPNNTLIYDIEVDQSGRVYAGTADDVGYFEPDAGGFYRFVSVLEDVDAPSFGEIGRVAVLGDHVLYGARRHLLRWHPQDGVNWIDVPDGIRDVDVIDGRFVIQLSGKPAQTVDPETLSLSADPVGQCLGARTARWADGPDNAAYALVENRLWRREADGCHRPMATAIDAWLQEHRPLATTVFASGDIAIGTRRAGAAVLRPDGTLRLMVDESAGLASRWVTDLLVDHGILWMAFGDEGLARVDLASGLTSFGPDQGINTVEALARHQGYLLAGSQFGLFRLVAGTRNASTARFERLLPEAAAAWSLLSVGNSLLVGTDRDIWEVKLDPDGNVVSSRRLYEGQSRVVHFARGPGDTVYATMGDGLLRLQRRNAAWLADGEGLGRHADIHHATQFSVVDGDVLWAGTVNGRYLRLSNLDLWPNADLEVFDHDDGVPEGNAHVFRIDGETVFGSYSGVHHFDGSRFSPDPRFGYLAEPIYGIRRMHGAPDGAVWYKADHEFGALRRHGDAYAPGNPAIQELKNWGVYAIHADPDGVVWIGGTDGVYRLDANQRRPAPPQQRIVLRSVADIDSSILFHSGLGAGPAQSLGELPPLLNSLRFRFSYPARRLTENVLYRFRLVGFDHSWSTWTTETHKDYTRLPAGQYAFEVMARDGFGRESEPSKMQFRVPAPWYARPVAMASWALLAMLTVIAISLGYARVRTRRVRAESQRLEALVASRTADLADANARLDRLSRTDPLTGLHNRRALIDAMKGQGIADPRHLLMLDIDCFKKVNDTYGHDVGDRVLVGIAKRCQELRRDETELAVRWGGEEMLLVLKGNDAPARANQLLTAIHADAYSANGKGEVRCTASLGLASWPLFPAHPRLLDWEQCVRLADQAMYLAKRNGGDACYLIEPGEAAGTCAPDLLTYEALTRDLHRAIADRRLSVVDTSRQEPLELTERRQA